MELNDVLEDAQNFTYTLLRDYGYPDHDLIEQWFEANSQWEITFRRVNYSIGLMEDLEKLLQSKLTHIELESLQTKCESIRRGRRLFNIFYQDSERFITRNLQYSTWLHQLHVEPQAEALGVSKFSIPDSWWDAQAELSREASDRLREILVADDPQAARTTVLKLLRLMQQNVMSRSAQVNPEDAIPTPEIVLPLNKLTSNLDSLEIDHMFFD